MLSKDKRAELVQQIHALGVCKGDIILVRGDLGSIGRISGIKRPDFVSIFLDAIGQKGTLVGLAFTGSNYLKKDKSKVFDKTSKSTSGAFSNAMLAYPNAKRSSHPSNSFVAIGPNADFILKDHDIHASCYEPIRKLLYLKGKMIVFGCVDSSPGFTTTHLVEEDLGIDKRIIFPWLSTCYYRRSDNSIGLYRRKQVGGCSSTFYKFYKFYKESEALRQGFFGDSYSICIDATDAYRIEKKILEGDSKFNICNSQGCTLCRARRWDNIKDIPKFYARKIARKFLKYKE